MNFEDYPKPEVFNNIQYQSIENLQTACICGHFYHAHTIFIYPSSCLVEGCLCTSFKKRGPRHGYAGMIGCSCGKKISSTEIREHLEKEHTRAPP